MKTIYKADAYEYVDSSRKNMLFTSIADDGVWFDSWPGMMHIETMDTFENSTQSHRPLKMLWGDGEEFTRDDIQSFIDMYDNHGFVIHWTKGDMLFICNYRFVHGRPEYFLGQNGVRDIEVALGPKFTRQGQK